MKNPFRVPTKPRAATSSEWRQWKKEAKRNYPIRYWLSEVLTRNVRCAWLRWVKDPWYYAKCALWRRHNVIRCAKLPPTWSDRDTLILHAVFQCLTDFIEREEPWEFAASDDEFREAYRDWPERAECDIAIWREIRDLYAWWQAYSPPEFESFEKESAAHDAENEKLKRLIDLRGHFWT